MPRVALHLVLLTAALTLSAGPALAAEVRVYVADAGGKTLYVGYMRATLTVHVAGEEEPRSLRLRHVELEKGHRAVNLDHDGQILRSVVEGEPTYFAEVVVAPPRDERTSSFYRGVLVGGPPEGEGGEPATPEIEGVELELDLRGETRKFVAAPPGSLLRWVSGLSYPLSTCVVSGERLDPELVPRLQVQGRTFLLCCGRCKRQVRDDPAPQLVALDLAIVGAQLPTYPLEACPITGEPVDLAEAPADIVLEGNRLVRLASASSEAAARRRASAIIDTIDHAVVERQLPTYPLSTCVVCGETLGVEPVNYVLGTRLVRLCCKDCIPAVEVDPEGHLARIDAAAGER